MIDLSKYIPLGAPAWFARTTVLHLAIYGGQQSLAEELMYDFSDDCMVDLESAERVTAFHLAVANDDWPTVEGLLEMNYDPEHLDQYGLNALALANCFNTGLIKRLLGQGASPFWEAYPFDAIVPDSSEQEVIDEGDNDGSGDVEMIVLKSPPVEVQPLLFRAVMAEAYDTAKMLIWAAGPGPTSASSEDELALSYEGFLGTWSGVPAVATLEGQEITLLNCVIAFSGKEKARLALVEEMIRSKADLRINDVNFGHTALMRAVLAKSPTLLKLLLETCPDADVNVYSDEGQRNCLIAAVEPLHCELPAFVCHNTLTASKQTHDLTLVKLLLPHLSLSSFEAVNAEGLTAIAIAESRGNASLLKVLQDKYRQLKKGKSR